MGLLDEAQKVAAAKSAAVLSASEERRRAVIERRRLVVTEGTGIDTVEHLGTRPLFARQSNRDRYRPGWELNEYEGDAFKVDDGVVLVVGSVVSTSNEDTPYLMRPCSTCGAVSADVHGQRPMPYIYAITDKAPDARRAAFVQSLGASLAKVYVCPHCTLRAEGSACPHCRRGW